MECSPSCAEHEWWWHKVEVGMKELGRLCTNVHIFLVMVILIDLVEEMISATRTQEREVIARPLFSTQKNTKNQSIASNVLLIDEIRRMKRCDTYFVPTDNKRIL